MALILGFELSGLSCLNVKGCDAAIWKDPALIVGSCIEKWDVATIEKLHPSSDG
jgi:hypothetical protein